MQGMHAMEAREAKQPHSIGEEQQGPAIQRRHEKSCRDGWGHQGTGEVSECSCGRQWPDYARNHRGGRWSSESRLRVFHRALAPTGPRTQPGRRVGARGGQTPGMRLKHSYVCCRFRRLWKTSFPHFIEVNPWLCSPSSPFSDAAPSNQKQEAW